jgi:hypothetical protein
MVNQDFPNTGTLWHEAEKKHPKAPDFKGSIGVDRAYLQEILNDQSETVVEIKLDGWRNKVEVNGDEKHVLRLSVNTWKPDATHSNKGRRDETIPF